MAAFHHRLDDVKESSNYSFPTEEEAILQLWDATDAFKEQLRLTENKPEFSFYDGPPFATGLPHYGHILAGTIKVPPPPARPPPPPPEHQQLGFPSAAHLLSTAAPPRCCRTL